MINPCTNGPCFPWKLTKLFKQTKDDSTSLIAVPSTYSLSQAFKFPNSSGNLWKFEKPSRLRFTRDFNLYRLHKRLLNLLQSSKDKYRIRTTHYGWGQFFICSSIQAYLFYIQQPFKFKLTTFFKHGINEQFGVLIKKNCWQQWLSAGLTYHDAAERKKKPWWRIII